MKRGVESARKRYRTAINELREQLSDACLESIVADGLLEQKVADAVCTVENHTSFPYLSPEDGTELWEITLYLKEEPFMLIHATLEGTTVHIDTQGIGAEEETYATECARHSQLEKWITAEVIKYIFEKTRLDAID